MKFGFRMPSLKKRVSARLSIKKKIRSKIRMPKGTAILTSPKRVIYNKIYNKSTVDPIKFITSSAKSASKAKSGDYTNPVVSKNFEDNKGLGFLGIILLILFLPFWIVYFIFKAIWKIFN